MHQLMSAVTVVLVGIVSSGVVLAEQRGPMVVYEEAKASDLLKKYRTGYLELKGSNYFPGQSINPYIDELHKCRRGAESCKYGWDAARGKLDPKMAELLRDMLHTSRWGGKHTCSGTHGQPDYICGKNGEKWTFTILGPGDYMEPYSIRNAMSLLPFYETEGAAGAIAKTLSTNQRFADLYAGQPAAIDALFRLAAKEQLPTILKAIRYTGPRNTRDHMRHALIGLLDWRLTAEQHDAIVDFCAELFEDTEAQVKDVAACVRYIGLTGTTNEDARAFISNWANGSGDSWLRIHAIRSAAGLLLKDSKQALQANLNKAYKKRTVRVKKGRKYKETKRDTWSAHHHAVESAVALFGMKDKNAKKAIAYWLSFEERGGSQTFVHSQGFRLVARDAAFAEGKSRKALHKMISKAFKKGVKLSKDNSGMQSTLFKVALGLSQMGDKNAIKYLMEYVDGKQGRANDIETIFRAWGSEAGRLVHGSNSELGLGRLPIGGVLTSKDGASITKVLEKKLRFWDKNLKTSAVRLLLKLRAQMYAADNSL